MAPRQTLVERFRTARDDPELAVLEGLHPLKHALRFGASVLTVASPDPERVCALAGDLAPDLVPRLREAVDAVPRALFEQLTPVPPATGVVAIARRPDVDVGGMLAAAAAGPVVFLEEPAHLGNLGAAIRVAAAADAAGLLTQGRHDPWHPEAVRGAAGLQFALPLANVPALPPSDRPIVALDPGGDALSSESVPRRAVLAFGTERSGLSDSVLERADARLRIPMRDGVSSLNLAVSVAIVLYASRWKD